MKHRSLAVVALMAMAIAAALPASAQVGYITVKGSFKGADGKPVPDVQVDFASSSTGQKYHLKTDKKGEFYSIGVSPGVYDITFTKDGEQLWQMTNYTLSLSKPELNNIYIDLQKENAKPQQGGTPKVSEEQKKQVEAVQKTNATIKELNAMLQQSHDAITANDPDSAVTVMTKATQMDPSRAVLWEELGRAQTLAAKKDEDAGSRKEKYAAAGESLKKAIDLGVVSTDPKVKSQMGGYYNNYAEALTKTGKTPEAVAAYEAAATADPPNAVMYYTNEGITMENAGKTDEAVAAYDKAIAADATRPDAYFRKGITLLAKATTKGDKMVPAPGTAESFNKYLELAPDGPNAETAKQMLQTLGAPVPTSYGKQKVKK
jgi:tetratricopeptide (TPR) repeat protein